jgi:glycosyltransferase involved in cell wall biosynthesis
MISWSPNDYRLNLLKQSLASLRACTPGPHALVVVDNGPPAQTDWLRTQDLDIHCINRVNQGVGISRNQGARLTESDYLAFVDSDILFFPDWLTICVGLLERFPNEKLIATARKTTPMRQRKYFAGLLEDCELWRRCAGMCLVMRRETYLALGGFSLKSNVGHVFCETARANGYHFLWHPSCVARHLGKKKSYDYRRTLVNGEWMDNGKPEQGE